MSQHETPIARSASESATTGSEKSRISVIEKSVTHLLVATKTLLETLTKWSKRQATESEVSDVYVRLGYEFNIACRAFKSVGVETSDLGPVPDLLRGILEETLSGEPSHSHLDQYLPQIRDIIVNLLQGLKRKQQRLRQRASKYSEGSSSSLVTDIRHSTSVGGYNGTSSSLDSISRQSLQGPRQELPDIPTSQDGGRNHTRPTSVIQPQRSGSGKTRAPYIMEPTFYPSGSTISGRQSTESAEQPSPSNTSDSSISESKEQTLLPPDADSPQPQGRHGDALAALQRGGELERRASRRFSSYQIQKHLGTSSSGIPMIPPTQNSPIPNRGRDLKESMTAVRTRGGTQLHNRGPSKNKYAFDTSPTRQPPRHETIETIVDDPVVTTSSTQAFELPADISPIKGPLAKTPEDKLRESHIEPKDLQATQTDGVSYDSNPRDPSPIPDPVKQSSQTPSTDTLVRHPSRKTTPSLDQTPDTASDRPSSTKELTLFLQYKTRIKKFVLADGYDELSIARLQLAFIEKFAWNTHSNGVDLPEIYIQDPVSGVRHELEDLSDVKNRTVLALNVDAVDEVKKHMDDGMGGLKTILQDVRSAVTDQTSVLQRVADKQQDASKEFTRLASQLPSAIQSLPTASAQIGMTTKISASAQLTEIQSLRRDLAVMRQTYTSWVSDMEASMSTIRNKANAVKAAATKKPTFTPDENDAGQGRAYVAKGRKTLNNTSEAIMTRVEDLQDTVEDLRKDVVTRGVRPLPRQLETVNKELSVATAELKKLQEHLLREKPVWTEIWKNELQMVCEDQNWVKFQDELIPDLEADLAGAAETFALVEEATKQQNLANGTASGTASNASGSRNPSRTLNPVSDFRQAKDSLMGEVKALQPNHESRLEAIERAERLRQKELEERKEGEEFRKELTGFVDEGRLKKSGGFEEAERVRKVKDERMRKQVWNRINGRPDSFDATSDGPSPVDAAAASLDEVLPDDLSTLAGSGLPPDAVAEKADAAIAESASVPLPLDVPEHGSAMTPEPEFVEATERQEGFF